MLKRMATAHGIDHEPYIDESVSERHNLAARYEQLLEQARAIPGMEHFGMPKKFHQLRAAATHSHIVLIHVHQTRCDALIISSFSESIIHVPLPDLKYNEIEKWYSTMFDVLKHANVHARADRPHVKKGNHGDTNPMMNILEALWKHLIRPILSRLEVRSIDSFVMVFF